MICETRDLMNAVTRLCTNVFVCQAKVSNTVIKFGANLMRFSTINKVIMSEEISRYESFTR